MSSTGNFCMVSRHVCPLTIHIASAALRQTQRGSNLTALALQNYLRGLGIEREADLRRIVDIVTNPNSLFGTKGGKNPINPYVRHRRDYYDLYIPSDEAHMCTYAYVCHHFCKDAHCRLGTTSP